VTLPGWVHVVGVFDGVNNVVVVYTNGVASSLRLPAGVSASEDSSPVIIGGALQGYVDELYFYTTALTAAQVCYYYIYNIISLRHSLLQVMNLYNRISPTPKPSLTMRKSCPSFYFCRALLY